MENPTPLEDNDVSCKFQLYKDNKWAMSTIIAMPPSNVCIHRFLVSPASTKRFVANCKTLTLWNKSLPVSMMIVYNVHEHYKWLGNCMLLHCCLLILTLFYQITNTGQRVSSHTRIDHATSCQTKAGTSCTGQRRYFMSGTKTCTLWRYDISICNVILNGYWRTSMQNCTK